MYISFNYLRGTLLFDLASTLPGILTNEVSFWYPVKLIRFIHAKTVQGFISEMVTHMLTKLNLNNAAIEKLTYIVNLNVVLFSIIHIVSCCWIYLGKTVEGSWIDVGGPDAPNYMINNNDPFEIYVTAFYWVITTVTTVGYGDYRGYTS